MKRIALPAFALAMLVLLAAPPALAEKLGWYTGLGVGVSNGEVDDDTIEDELARQVPGATVGTIERDRSSLMSKVLLGYSFTSFLAVEASAFWLGEFEFEAPTSPTGTFKGRTDVWGGSIDLLAFIPLTERWRLFGRAGGVFANTKTSLDAVGIALSDDYGEDTDWGWKAGAGVAYEFDSGVGFRAEWEHYRVKDGFDEWMDIDTFSGSVLYRFK